MVVLESCSGFVRPQSSLALLGVMLTLFARHFITYLGMLWEWAGPVLQSPKGPNFSIQVSEVAKLSSSQPAMKTIGDFGGAKSARKTPKNHQRRGNSWEFVVISNGDLPIFGRLA